MDRVCHRITLDINDNNSQIALPIRETDTGRAIYVSLTEDGIPVNLAACFATCSGKLENGLNKLTAVCLTDFVNNRFEIIIPDGMSHNKGMWVCSLDVYNAQNEGHIGTPRFNVVVDERIFGLTDEEAGEAGYTTDLVNMVGQAASNLSLVAQNAASAAVNANSAAQDVKDKLEELNTKETAIFNQISANANAHLEGIKSDLDDAAKDYRDELGGMVEGFAGWIGTLDEWDGDEKTRQKNEEIRIANEKDRIAADKARQKWVAPVIEKTIENWLDETVSDGGLSSIDFNRLTPQMFAAECGLDIAQVGDGTTDNSGVIQAMFDRATEGAKIFFPAGTYIVHPFASLGYRKGDTEGHPSQTAWSKSKYGYGIGLFSKSNITIEFEKGAIIKSALTYKDDNGVVQFKEHVIDDDFNDVDEISATFYLHTGTEFGGDLVNSGLFKIRESHNIKIIGGEFMGDIPEFELDVTGHPKGFNEVVLHRNTSGVLIDKSTDIAVSGVNSHNFRGGSLHVGGNSSNITVRDSEFSRSYYHAIVNEGASNVRYINVKAYWAFTGEPTSRYKRSKDGEVWSSWGRTHRPGNFGTSADIEGTSSDTPNKDILIEGCEFGYAETNALNIIYGENITVRNCVIKDKPLGVQESCVDVHISNNELIESQFYISKDNVNSIVFDGNHLKNSNIRYTSSGRSYHQSNIIIRNNYIIQEDDIGFAYARECACIDISLKNNSSVDVTNNTIIINDGRYRFVDVGSDSDDSHISVSHNHFVGGSNIKPLKDMYYVLFKFSSANVEFLHNKIDVYGAENLVLNSDGTTISRLWVMYLVSTKTTTTEQIKIAYNDFKILTPSLKQAQYIFTTGTTSIERDDFCKFYNNTMYSTGSSVAYAYKLFNTYGFKIFNNILDNYINTSSALYEKSDKLVAINNIVNGVLQ